MNTRWLAVLLVLPAAACSSTDTTELSASERAASTPREPAEPLAPLAPPPRAPRSSPRAAAGADVGDAPAATDTNAAVARELGDAGAALAPPANTHPDVHADAGSDPPESPCLLRLEWSRLEASHPDCSSLSDLPAAELALWDGAHLSVLGAEWTLEDGRIERTRRCQHDTGQLWRFEEHVALAVALPALGCPDAPIEASYGYDECPLLSPGTVCAAGEPSACQLSATLRLVPVPAAAATAVENPLLENGERSASEREASCRPVGRDPRRPITTGERCYDGECSAGLFCSRELADGACAALGEGTCLPAPTSFDCGTTREALCTCTEPPTPLETLPLFDPTRPDALTPNTCTAHALGLSVMACPAD
jgi:hypothetical protein